MIFGSGPTVAPWRHHGRVEIHGPGYSKILLGRDKAASWREFTALMVASAADNSGRSCINASSVRTVSHGRELATALAERLVTIKPRPRDDPQAQLAAFPDPDVARAINTAIESGLAQGGAALALAPDGDDASRTNSDGLRRRSCGIDRVDLAPEVEPCLFGQGPTLPTRC